MKSVQILCIILALFLLSVFFADQNSVVPQVHATSEIAQTFDTPTPSEVSPTPSPATPSASLTAKEKSAAAEEQVQINKIKEINTLFARRPAPKLTVTNFMAYYVQQSVRVGVPIDTVLLLLLMPLLATIVVFFRHVIGIPSLGILVPIALSITLLSTGITIGLLLLAIIIIASLFARVLFQRVRIIQLAKVALSLFVMSIFIFATLTFSASSRTLTSTQLSIFPVVLLILVSERIVAVQLERSAKEMTQITLLTIALGILGFLLLSSTAVRDIVLLYPETILLLLPINWIIGRYFGLRLTEYFRFIPVIRYGSK
ncbi:MAG TPA: 7TM domain-containing protein [Candidatus Saccharimonadales bacterium]|nr:7TM domain-containing protein [Candidatus Saccharimonadales bacterium]